MNDFEFDLLVESLLDGDQNNSVLETRRLLDAGAGRKQIITLGIESAMQQLDARCTAEQFNLLEIMLCGRAVMEVMKELYPPGAPAPETKATIVLASLQGDVHDLGKNIFKMVLTATGYRVVDCGKDCPLEKLIDAIQRENALAVGISGLITTIIPQARRVRDKLIERGLGRVKTLAGGAALKQATAESIQVDFVGQTAFDGARYLDQLTGSKR